MTVFDGPIKCELVYTSDARLTTQYKLSDLQGNVLPENEQIDIGQDAWPFHWPEEKKKFRWGIINFTDDILKEYWQQRVWAAVFSSFGFLIPRKYQYVDNIAEGADFTIAHLDDPSRFSSLNVLAHAWLYYPRSEKNGIIEFNDKIHYFTPLGRNESAHRVDPVNYPDPDTPVKLRTQPQVQIGMHEVFHSHGFRHDLTAEDSLMAPYVKPGYGPDGKVISKNFIWHDRDIKRLQDIYGNRNLVIRWLNYFRMRRIKESEYYR